MARVRAVEDLEDLADLADVADVADLVDLGEVLLGEVLRADGATDCFAVCFVDRDRASSRGRRAPEERW